MSRMQRRYTPEFRAKTAALRRQGYSLYELRDLLKVRLATVQGWVRDVPLSIKAKRRIRRRILEGGKKARARAAVVNRQKIEVWKQGIREKSRLAIQEVPWNLSLGKLLCTLLYVCEGSRYPSSRALGFGNSNPRIIRFFLHLLRCCFGVDEWKFRCQIPHRWDQNLDLLVRYWSRITGIPKRQFYRTKPDRRTKGRETLRKDYRGVCFIQYLDTALQFTLQSIGEALMEMAGKNGGAGENRTLAPSMPWRYAPSTPRPREQPV